jgi:hypothetical protein
LALNRCAGISPTGHPLAGSNTSGSRKCASNAAAPAASRLAVSSAIATACCQDIDPACNAAKVRGNLAVTAWEVTRNDPAARGPRASKHPISAATAISCATIGASGPATAQAVSAYRTAAFAFSPAIPASTSRAPARMSRHPSARPPSGSVSENVNVPEPSNSASSTARAARISPNAFATAAFPITPS